jgi:CheY-like chemotaxis protein
VTNAKKIILIVEDEPIIKALKLKFEQAGFTVEIAENGLEAVEKVHHLMPDVILLDILLPKLNGFEFLKVLKKESQLNKIPVIVFSNLGSREDVELAKSLGVREYVVKIEVNMDDLIRKVEQYVK